MNHQHLRTSFLAFTTSLILLSLSRAVVVPKTQATPKNEFDFPPAVNLSNWQAVKPDKLTLHESLLPEADQVYSYVKDPFNLTIELRYVNGNTPEWMVEKRVGIPKSDMIYRQQNNLGSYALFSNQNKAYLSSCINPWGESTFTRQDYAKSQSVQGIQWARIIPWLMGKEALRAQNCVWTQMSLTVENASPEELYPTLEEVWFSWHQRWLENPPEN